MIVEKTIATLAAFPTVIAVIDPSIQNISVAFIGAVVTITTVVFAYKTASLNKKLEAQNTIIAEVKKTSDGMKDALVAATGKASHAAGLAEGAAKAEAKASLLAAAKAEGVAESQKETQAKK